jgi:ATP-binding cassette subfamily F protein 3
LLLISHDRYFLDKLVNRVFGLHNGGIQIFEGNYSDYLKNREATESEEVNRETGEKQNIKKSDKLKERKRREAEARQFISKERNRLEAEIRELEAQVEELELEKSELEKRIGHPETYSDGEQVAQIQIRYRDVRKILEELMHSWEYKNIEYEELLESLRSGMMGGE